MKGWTSNCSVKLYFFGTWPTSFLLIAWAPVIQKVGFTGSLQQYYLYRVASRMQYLDFFVSSTVEYQGRFLFIAESKFPTSTCSFPDIGWHLSLSSIFNHVIVCCGWLQVFFCCCCVSFNSSDVTAGSAAVMFSLSPPASGLPAVFGSVPAGGGSTAHKPHPFAHHYHIPGQIYTHLRQGNSTSNVQDFLSYQILVHKVCLLTFWLAVYQIKCLLANFHPKWQHLNLKIHC